MRSANPGDGFPQVHAAWSLKLRDGGRAADALQITAGEIRDRDAAADRSIRRRVLQSAELQRAARAEIRGKLGVAPRRASEARRGNRRWGSNPPQAPRHLLRFQIGRSKRVVEGTLGKTTAWGGLKDRG